MATTGTYYFDQTSFTDASTIYTDASLQTVAPDGFYGFGGIYREQVSGVLGAILPCSACDPSCGASTVSPEYQLYENSGTYNVTVDLGEATGAIIVRTNPYDSNVKFQWTYDGTTASEYSSVQHGYLQGVIGLVSPSGDCSALPLTNANGSNAATLAGEVYNYNANFPDAGLTQWENTGEAVTLGPYANEAAGGVTLTATATGNCYMVIPKPNAFPTTVTFQMDITCLNADFELEPFCPAPLTGIPGTTTSHSSCTQVCSADFDTTYYTAPVSGIAGQPAVNDWIFTDANGVNPLSDSHWGISFNGNNYCITVANGVITSLTICT